MHHKRFDIAPWRIPLSIIIAGCIVGASIYASNVKVGLVVQKGSQNQPPVADIKIRPVSASDHILGNPKAPVMIVEYSDTECPFCKKLQANLQHVMAAHEKTGDVAWVFRYFPVHQRSEKEAEAQECVAELAGNDAFWKFTDQVFAETNSNDSLDPETLSRIATGLGIDGTKFGACLTSGKYKDKILADRSEAAASGSRGTPWSVVLGKGKPIALTGAVPPESIETAIKNGLR